MFEYLLKKFSLSWHKSQSPSAKSKSGDAMANSGDNSVQQKGRYIYNNISLNNKSSIEEAKDWQSLEDCFTEEKTNHWINQVNDPRFRKPSDIGLEKSISKKFKKVKLSKDAAHKLNTIKEDVDHCINNYFNSRDEKQFKKEWISFKNQIKSIQNYDI